MEIERVDNFTSRLGNEEKLMQQLELNEAIYLATLTLDIRTLAGKAAKYHTLGATHLLDVRFQNTDKYPGSPRTVPIYGIYSTSTFESRTQAPRILGNEYSVFKNLVKIHFGERDHIDLVLPTGPRVTFAGGLISDNQLKATQFDGNNTIRQDWHLAAINQHDYFSDNSVLISPDRSQFGVLQWDALYLLFNLTGSFRSETMELLRNKRDLHSHQDHLLQGPTILNTPSVNGFAVIKF
jgi:hypothetical protein